MFDEFCLRARSSSGLGAPLEMTADSHTQRWDPTAEEPAPCLDEPQAVCSDEPRMSVQTQHNSPSDHRHSVAQQILSVP